MGFKRPFDDDEFQTLPFKHQRQLEYSNKQTLFAEITNCENKDGFPKPGDDKIIEGSIVATKDFENNLPFSRANSNTENYVGIHSSPCVGYFEYDIPTRSSVQFEDIYSPLLDRSARKQVPIGPNHQANIPVWNTQKDEDTETITGTCIIPLSDSNLSSPDFNKPGAGRRDCSCLDKGSVLCVQQHITEARDKLKKTLGHEIYVQLGFYEMGEEVACKWSEEEEQVFHEIVFSNPVSYGKRFWTCLSMMFPSRTKRELVSYYFNVFMLRRRAAQNRCTLLDIDSDDDEWHGSNEDSFKVVCTEDDEEDSVIEDDSSSDDSDDDGDSDNDGGETNVEESSRKEVISEVKHNGFFGEDFGIQDDSCMSFESCHQIERGLDSKVWDGRYSVGHDLLPTCRMIEEIFGMESWSNK